MILFPLYVVSEYVLRRPLGFLTVQAERANLANALVDIFTFGVDRQAGLIPTTLLDFGFRPSVGLYFFWNRAFTERNEIRVHAATWGDEWLRLTVTDRVNIAEGTQVGVRVEGSRRSDWVFYGLGPRSSSDAMARFSRDQLDASFFMNHEGWRSSHFRAFAGVRHVLFDDRSCCEQPPIGTRVAQGAYAAPPGFPEGYTIARTGFIAELDSRRAPPMAGSGGRLVLRAEQAARTDGGEPRQWLRFGGALGAYLDVTQHNRVIGLSVGASFVDPIGSNDEIPFTEQIALGGEAPMRGFLEGRLVDRSWVGARLDYEWPVWTFLNGAINAEVGNVFGEHLSGFEPEAARLSFSLGVRSIGRRDHPFELLLGTGTTPIDEGAHLDSFRLVFGATNGF